MPNQIPTVSEECYRDIEVWLEEYYLTFPFHRIYENGVRLGYKGFMRHFNLEIDEVIAGVIEVRVVSKENGSVRISKRFDVLKGNLNTPEYQGHLL